MLTTTFWRLWAEQMAKARYRRLAKALGGVTKYGGNTPISLDRIVEINGVEDGIWALCATVEDSRPVSRELVCRALDRVLPHYEEAFPGDDRPRRAVAAARKDRDSQSVYATEAAHEARNAGNEMGYQIAFAARLAIATNSSAQPAAMATEFIRLAAQAADPSGKGGRVELAAQEADFRELLASPPCGRAPSRVLQEIAARAQKKRQSAGIQGSYEPGDGDDTALARIRRSICRGDKATVAKEVVSALSEGASADEILLEGVQRAFVWLLRAYLAGNIYVPDLLIGITAAERVKAVLAEDTKATKLGRYVFANTGWRGNSPSADLWVRILNACGFQVRVVAYSASEEIWLNALRDVLPDAACPIHLWSFAGGFEQMAKAIANIRVGAIRNPLVVCISNMGFGGGEPEEVLEVDGNVSFCTEDELLCDTVDQLELSLNQKGGGRVHGNA